MTMPEMEDITVNTEIIIESTPDTLYNVWRKFTTFSSIFNFLESVHELDRNHYQCTAPVISNQERLSWNIEITEEQSNHHFSWHSYSSSDFLFEGSANFTGKGPHKTEIRLQLRFYFPLMYDSQPYMMGEEFKEQVGNDLLRFKLAWEAGEFPLLKEKINELPDGLGMNQSKKSSFTTEYKKGDSRKNNKHPPPL